MALFLAVRGIKPKFGLDCFLGNTVAESGFICAGTPAKIIKMWVNK